MKKTHVGNIYLFTCLLIHKRIRARENFIFSKPSTRALGTIQPSNSIGTAALSSQVKRSGRETDHSPLSSAEVKNGWCYTSIPPECLHDMLKGKFIYTRLTTPSATQDYTCGLMNNELEQMVMEAVVY